MKGGERNVRGTAEGERGSGSKNAHISAPSSKNTQKNSNQAAKNSNQAT